MAPQPIGMLLYTQLIMFPPYSSLLAAAMTACALQITLADSHSSNNAYINYTTIAGYFLQDEPSTNSTTFDFMTTNVRFLLALTLPCNRVGRVWLGDVESPECLRISSLI